MITGADEIVDGHLVLEAARQLGVKTIACVVIDHLSAADIRRLRISLNRISETGSWDFGELSIDIKELAVEFGEDFRIPGFDADELDNILLDDEALGTGQIDQVPTQTDKAVSRLGDIWQLGPHRLGCGSARDTGFIRGVIPDGVSPTLCLTDPPYGVPITGHVTSGNHRDFVEGGKGTTKKELFALLKDSFTIIENVLVDGGLCLAFIDWRGLDVMHAAAMAANLVQLNLIVWAKTNGGMGSLWRSQHELCPVFKKGKAPHINNVGLGKKGRYRSNLWTYPGASSLGSDARDGLLVHPTVKPVALLEDAILDGSNRGDTVFDPFSGSGSTLIAAHRTGRLFCGSELDPLYSDVILKRWIALTGNQPVEIAAGEIFAERLANANRTNGTA